jgi:hypothetical protein
MLLAAILLAAVANSRDPDPVVIDKVVAIVDDQVFFQSDLIAEAHRAAKADGAKGNPDERLGEVLEQFVTTAILLVDAKRAKIEVPSYEIDQALEVSARDRKITVEQLYTEQEAAGVSKALVREGVRRQMVAERWIFQKVLPRIPRSIVPKNRDGFQSEAFQKAYAEELRKIVAELRLTMHVEVRP